MRSQHYHIRKKFQWTGEVTSKVQVVMEIFGLDIDRLNTNNDISYDCDVELRDGDICYITGASGAGKSVILGELYRLIGSDEKIWLGDIELAGGNSLIDHISGECIDSLRVLSKCGLGDVFCVLNTPAALSQGQKYRYRLAKAIDSGKRIIFADEFCANLDVITAAVVSYNLRKIAKQNGITLILAGTREDVMADLLPDVVIAKRFNEAAEVVYKDRARNLNAGKAG